MSTFYFIISVCFIRPEECFALRQLSDESGWIGFTYSKQSDWQQQVSVTLSSNESISPQTRGEHSGMPVVFRKKKSLSVGEAVQYLRFIKLSLYRLMTIRMS